ncbi:translation initiation factor IF-2 [Triticum aestivum]|uniref:translation initiation factor IF-2 n=1 Tax=Triticum aestivum TaxID=4565 RepID=UPI001D022EAA|nr:translation initiation factor IF-2-like [Triticum aestivum]
MAMLSTSSPGELRRLPGGGGAPAARSASVWTSPKAGPHDAALRSSTLAFPATNALNAANRGGAMDDEAACAGAVDEAADECAAAVYADVSYSLDQPVNLAATSRAHAPCFILASPAAPLLCAATARPPPLLCAAAAQPPPLLCAAAARPPPLTSRPHGPATPLSLLPSDLDAARVRRRRTRRRRGEEEHEPPQPPTRRCCHGCRRCDLQREGFGKRRREQDEKTKKKHCHLRPHPLLGSAFHPKLFTSTPLQISPSLSYRFFWCMPTSCLMKFQAGRYAW